MNDTLTFWKNLLLRAILIVVLLLVAIPGRAQKDRNDAAVKIMTQNMDAGTDLGFVVALGAPSGVDLTLAEIMTGRIPERADLLGKAIADEKPDLVALQEVTLWRTGPTPDTATNVLYDQLQMLLTTLNKYKEPYDVVAVNTVTDIALPGTTGAVRFTDRNALLMRASLRPPALHISEVHSRIFDATLNFQGLIVPAGWITASIHMGNRHFQFVTTHLQSPVPGFPEATEVQTAQATQLIHELRNVRVPVIMAGDFNADAILGSGGSGPDNTDTVALIESAGYAEVWQVANPGNPGPTWPLYLEDQYPPPFYFAPFSPFERIDLFFSKGIDAVGAGQVVVPLPFLSGSPCDVSDHAGVIAIFQP